MAKQNVKSEYISRNTYIISTYHIIHLNFILVKLSRLNILFSEKDFKYKKLPNWSIQAIWIFKN